MYFADCEKQRRGKKIVHIATFPGKVCFTWFSSSPLDPVMGTWFWAWRWSLSTSLDNVERCYWRHLRCTVWLQNSTTRTSHYKNFTRIIYWALTLLNNRTQVDSSERWTVVLGYKWTSAGIASRKGCTTRQLCWMREVLATNSNLKKLANAVDRTIAFLKQQDRKVLH